MPGLKRNHFAIAPILALLRVTKDRLDVEIESLAVGFPDGPDLFDDLVLRFIQARHLS